MLKKIKIDSYWVQGKVRKRRKKKVKQHYKIIQQQQKQREF